MGSVPYQARLLAVAALGTDEQGEGESGGESFTGSRCRNEAPRCLYPEALIKALISGLWLSWSNGNAVALNVFARPCAMGLY